MRLDVRIAIRRSVCTFIAPYDGAKQRALSSLREPIREGAPSVSVQSALLHHYPLNIFLLLPEAEGRNERKLPKRLLLSVLPFDAFLTNLR